VTCANSKVASSITISNSTNIKKVFPSSHLQEEKMVTVAEKSSVIMALKKFKIQKCYNHNCGNVAVTKPNSYPEVLVSYGLQSIITYIT
jgi:hypothetical protein